MPIDHAGLVDTLADFAHSSEWEVCGFNSSFFVEVVSVPAPGAVALFGLAGLAGRRRRRSPVTRREIALNQRVSFGGSASAIKSHTSRSIPFARMLRLAASVRQKELCDQRAPSMCPLVA